MYVEVDLHSLWSCGACSKEIKRRRVALYWIMYMYVVYYRSFSDSMQRRNAICSWLSVGHSIYHRWLVINSYFKEITKSRQTIRKFKSYRIVLFGWNPKIRSCIFGIIVAHNWIVLWWTVAVQFVFTVVFLFIIWVCVSAECFRPPGLSWVFFVLSWLWWWWCCSRPSAHHNTKLTVRTIHLFGSAIANRGDLVFVFIVWRETLNSLAFISHMCVCALWKTKWKFTNKIALVCGAS